MNDERRGRWMAALTGYGISGIAMPLVSLDGPVSGAVVTGAGAVLVAVGAACACVASVGRVDRSASV